MNPTASPVDVRHLAKSFGPRPALVDVSLALAPGTVTGVTLLDATEAGPVPKLLVAVTVKVYRVPLVRPPITMGEVVPVAVMLPGLDVTV